jgi:hypothetical protein
MSRRLKRVHPGRLHFPSLMHQSSVSGHHRGPKQWLHPLLLLGDFDTHNASDVCSNATRLEANLPVENEAHYLPNHVIFADDCVDTDSTNVRAPRHGCMRIGAVHYRAVGTPLCKGHGGKSCVRAWSRVGEHERG